MSIKHSGRTCASLQKLVWRKRVPPSPRQELCDDVLRVVLDYTGIVSTTDYITQTTADRVDWCEINDPVSFLTWMRLLLDVKSSANVPLLSAGSWSLLLDVPLGRLYFVEASHPDRGLSMYGALASCLPDGQALGAVRQTSAFGFRRFWLRGTAKYLLALCSVVAEAQANDLASGDMQEREIDERRLCFEDPENSCSYCEMYLTLGNRCACY